MREKNILFVLLLFLSVKLCSETIGPDFLPLSAVDNVNEIGFYTRGVSDNSFYSIFGKLTLRREHLFSFSFVREDFSCTLYDFTSAKVKNEIFVDYYYNLGYRYQFWDIDRPFLAVAGSCRYYEKEKLFFYDFDFSILSSPVISIGVEDINGLERFFVLVTQRFNLPVDVFCGLKLSSNYVDNQPNWSGTAFVGFSLREFRRFSDLGIRLEERFTRYGHLSTFLGITLGFKNFVHNADLMVDSNVSSHDYLGINGDFKLKVFKLKHPPEVEMLIKEFRSLEKEVYKIQGFVLGQKMIEDIRSLIEQGAYEQARGVIEKLRLYLKEW